MLKLISNADVSATMPLLEGDDYALFARAILAGRAPGRVYLDSEAAVAAIVSAEEARCYLALRNLDSPAEEWQRAILETVARDQYDNGMGFTEYYLPPDADGSVHEIFRGMGALWKPALLYHAAGDGLEDLPLQVPDGFSLQPVTDDWLAGKGVKNRKLITGEWKARTDNVNGVRGFCILHKDRVVSVCHIDFRYGDAVEIGVITDEKYRRMGLGTAAVANALEFFRKNGIKQFLWHAPRNNPGSCGVAEKCGFRVEREFGEYLLHCKPGMQSLMLGYEAVKSGDFQNALLHYTRALELEAGERKPFDGEFTREQVEGWIAECERKLGGSQ